MTAIKLEMKGAWWEDFRWIWKVGDESWGYGRVCVEYGSLKMEGWCMEGFLVGIGKVLCGRCVGFCRYYMVIAI